MKSKALVRSLAAASWAASGGRSQRVSMNLRMETVSYWVWSTYPFLANGEMMIAGMREPGPHLSTTGGAT